MQITKYLHSCLFVKDQETSILIDPGEYTYNENALDMHTIAALDFILITHEHSDHMSIPFIKEILSKFPKVQIIGPELVVIKLQENGIIAKSSGLDFITIESVPHEDVVLSVPPENNQYTLFKKLTHPGDSHHIRNTAPILALPIQAPWGSFADAIKLAEELSPKIVIPIHDWHWKDTVRQGMYQRAKEYLALSDIDFKILETGEIIEV